MRAEDFEYDGRLLSDIGMEIVQFDSGSGFDMTTAGSALSFDTISTRSGRAFPLVATHYDEVFTANISICKPDGATVTTGEYRYIMHWLNQKQYKKLRILADELVGICFYGTFNIEKVEHLGRIVGFNLEFTSNAPFGYGDQIQDSFSLSTNSSHTIDDNSDEFGEIPFDSFVITCNAAGTLSLENHYDNRVTTFTDCQNGEIITIDGKTMTITSSSGRAIYDHFNFIYPKLVSTANIDELAGMTEETSIETLQSQAITTQGDGTLLITRGIANIYTSTLPCTIAVKYTPWRKVVF